MRLLPKIVLAVVLPVMAGAGAVLYVFAGSWQQTLERELVESARRELVARVDTVPAGLQAGRDTLRLLARAPVVATGNVPEIRRALREWAIGSRCAIAPITRNWRPARKCSRNP